MPDWESLVVSLGTLAVLIVVGWFALGTQSNVRAGDRVMKWLQGGLPLIGEKAALHWMGSSVMQLRMAKGKTPFRNTEALVVFEPRDVIFLWILSRLQGRRDLMIFRGTLNAAPSFELEIFDPKGWTTHNTERDVQKKNWTPVAVSNPSALKAYFSGNAGASIAQALTTAATRSGAKLVRLSIHRDLPNVEVHWLLPNLQTVSAHDFFSNLRDLSEQVLRG